MRVADVSRRKDGALEVDVLVSPRSNRSGPEGFDEWRRRLVLRVRAPPLDGRANREVEETLESITGMRCRVTAGMTSRQKTVTISGDPDRAEEALDAAALRRLREARPDQQDSGRAELHEGHPHRAGGGSQGRGRPDELRCGRRVLLRPERRGPGEGRGGRVEGREVGGDTHRLGPPRRDAG